MTELKRKYFRWERSMSGLWMPVFHTENPTRYDRKEDAPRLSIIYEVDSEISFEDACAKYPAPKDKESNDGQNLPQP